MKRYVFITQVVIIVTLLLSSLSSFKSSEYAPSVPASVSVHKNMIETLFNWQFVPTQAADSVNPNPNIETNEQPSMEHEFKIMIDAGHGGRDPGSAGANEQEEKQYTLSLANKVYDLLQKEKGIKPILTREDDSYLTTEERVAMANESQADVFISLHANSFINSKTRGTETYYYYENSLAFANILHEQLIQATGFFDRKVRQMDYKVIKETTMPAALLEIGYYSNPTEQSIMMTEDMQNKVAASIVEGIKQYMSLEF